MSLQRSETETCYTGKWFLLKIKGSMRVVHERHNRNNMRTSVHMPLSPIKHAIGSDLLHVCFMFLLCSGGKKRTNKNHCP